MKLPMKLKQAMKTYYANREQQCEKKWDKQKDLNAIFDARPKNCTRIQAVAGTFWLDWQRPRLQTTHDETNYWTCKVLWRPGQKEV